MGYYTAGDYFMAGDDVDRAGLQYAGRGRSFPSFDTSKMQVENPRDPGFDLGYDAGLTAPRPYRRTNVGNIRALRRAMRRVQGFAKLAHKTISFTHRVKMKKRRK